MARVIGKNGPSEEEVNSQIQSAIDNLVDLAPDALNTLNELAQSLNDDADFAGTVTSSLAGKAEATDLTDHENTTTSVHGIADTSLLATTSYVDTAESDAVTTANAYSDSLATNYDPAGSASSAQSAAESYADSLSVNYDPAGSASTAESNANSYTDNSITTHNNDTTSVHGIADTSLLATTSYVDTAESDAVATANAYSDSLATNYDPAGSASSAQTAAESYADSLAINYDPAGSAASAQSAAELYASGLASNYDAAGSASSVASNLTDHENATTSVHGISDTSLLATTSYVDTAENDAVTTANAYSDSLAPNYDPAGSAAAGQSAAESYADSLSTNYDAVGSASTAESNANSYTDTGISTHNADTTNVHGIADTSLLATTSYVDAAESDAVTTANAYSDSLAINYDASGSAATAESNANTYTDTGISTHNSDTTNVHGIADTSALATKTYADNAAATAAANLVDSSPSTLDTLNELAAALGDDPNFATTVTNSLAAKADDADLTSHETATTNVHGIADTSLLATTSYVDTAESDAVTTANAYSDSLASNYDAAGSASAVASDLTDHENTTTNVHGIADTSLLATTSYVDTAESDAVTTANSYSDSLATNYDPAGSASTAQTAAQSYADSLAVNYDPAGSASAVASDLTDHENATTNVHGIADTSLLATTSYVDTAESDAVATASAYSDSLATNYDAAGSAAAAQSAAQSYADGLAVNYDSAGSASAVASDLTDHENATISVHGIADTSLLATTSYVDTAESDAVSTANSYADSLASNYDAAGSASAVASDLTDHENSTTNVHGIVDTSALATKTYADNAASTAAANLVDLAPGTLDTLNELAAALGDDPNFATTVTNSLAGKQPLDADLTAIAALTGTSGFLKKTAADTWSLDTNTYLTGNQTITLSGDVSGSGTTSITVTVADDSHNHIVGNVDGLQDALDAKAPLASPALTGTPTAPTATSGTSTTQIATTAYVQDAIERVTINAKTESYTLTLSDAGELIEINNASAITLTVPTNASQAFPIGTTITILQTGGGQITIAGESGVTINATPGLKTRTQWSSATLIKRGSDTWVALGDLTA